MIRAMSLCLSGPFAFAFSILMLLTAIRIGFEETKWFIIAGQELFASIYHSVRSLLHKVQSVIRKPEHPLA